MTLNSLEKSLQEQVNISTGQVQMPGVLNIPPDAIGVVLFAQDNCRRQASHQHYLLQAWHRAQLATLLISDLLTPEEAAIDFRTGHHCYLDVQLLATRLLAATHWLAQQPHTQHLKIGYFGMSSGGGAVLAAAADRPKGVKAIVACSGRLDLIGASLAAIQAPALLIVGEHDLPVLCTNQDALPLLLSPKQLQIIPYATHWLEEQGAIESVARLTCQWFTHYLTAADAQVFAQSPRC